MTITGYIQDYDGQVLKIAAPFNDTYHLTKQQITQCEIRLDDGRTISADQRKKIYATLRDMAACSGHEPAELKEILKYDYMAETDAEYFSLSDCSMTTANEYLSHILEVCIRMGFPLGEEIIKRSPDIARTIYACLAKKVCVCCGDKAELHHVDAVGTGRSRKEIVHEGMRVLPLCRKHHTEAHTMGRDSFCDKYHIFGISLDRYLCDIYRLRTEEEDG